MLALSIRQPFAELILREVKTVVPGRREVAAREVMPRAPRRREFVPAAAGPGRGARAAVDGPRGAPDNRGRRHDNRTAPVKLIRGFSPMAMILSYASVAKPRRFRPIVGIVLAVVCACSSAFIIWISFKTRLALESYVQTGWCGTPWLSLHLQQREIKYYLFLPAACLVAAWKLGTATALSRVSLSAAVAAWFICTFVG